MANIQRGQMLKQESLKIQFLDRYLRNIHKRPAWEFSLKP